MRDEYFKKNLIELKSFNLKINAIISLYDYLVRDIEDNSDEEVKKLMDERNEGKKMGAGGVSTNAEDPSNINISDDDNSSRNDSDNDRNVDDDE